MDNSTMLLIVVALLIIAADFWYGTVQRRRTHLRERFGPEYDRSVHETGSLSKAERTLAAREVRVRETLDTSAHR